MTDLATGSRGDFSSAASELPATHEDAIDGVMPRVVVEPASAEDVAAVLASASKRRASVVIRGGGTKMEWGRTPSPIDLVLSVRRLNALVAHEHADLTATVQAGARVGDVNRELARHGQWLPIESPFVGATIGGAIATNDSGPLRHKHGTPRDLVIGIRLALTDGRLIKAGGNVVKNVAGYDLGKLMSGSFGSLAAIVSATFKLMPLAVASNTLVARFETLDALVAAFDAIAASQLEMSAFEVQAFPYRLLLKFESTPGALNAHVRAAQALAEGATCQIVAAEGETELWREHVSGPWMSAGAVVRVTWLPASLRSLLAFVQQANGIAPVVLYGRAAIGSGLMSIEGDLDAQRRVIEQMRSRQDLFRRVTVLRVETDLKKQVDVWGPLGDIEPLGAAVKRALDPDGILNAGRGPV